MGQGIRGAGGQLLALAAIFVVFLVSSATASAGSPVVTARDAYEPGLVYRINQVRTARGLRPLRVADALTKAATRHGNSLSSVGYFRHDLYTPARAVTWTPFSAWVRWYWPGPGYTSWSAGENLAWGSPDLSPRATIRAWMNSPTHRANLLGRWRNVGVSVVHVTGPVGYFGSWGEVTVVAAEFGRRS